MKRNIEIELLRGTKHVKNENKTTNMILYSLNYIYKIKKQLIQKDKQLKYAIMHAVLGITRAVSINTDKYTFFICIYQAKLLLLLFFY